MYECIHVLMITENKSTWTLYILVSQSKGYWNKISDTFFVTFRDTNNRLEFDLMRDVHDIIIADEYTSSHPAYSSMGQEDSDIPEHTYSLRVSCRVSAI